MAYVWDTYYYFQSHSGTSGLYLNREGSGAAQPNQNISIYKPVGSGTNPDHQFKLVKAYDNSGNVAGCTLRSALASNYALNIYGYGSSMTAEGNCNLYPVGGQYPNSSNYNDSLIDLLTVDASQNLYKITLIKHPGLYLTPVGNYNNANVRWVAFSKENAHIGKLCTSENGGGGTGGGHCITLPTRKYCWPQFDSSITAICGNVGCSLTCVLDIANIFGPRSFTAREIADTCGWGSSGLLRWWLPNDCSGSLNWDNGYNPAAERGNILAVAKQQINANNPIIIKLTRKANKSDTHFVVAYKYVNNGTAQSDFYVLDPGTGTECSLDVAMKKNSKDYLYSYILSKR